MNNLITKYGKVLVYILLPLACVLLATSCSKDELSGDTIFPEGSPRRDKFDNWLLENYTYPYNVTFNYKFQDIESDMKYQLVPADSAKAAKLAIIVKYLWFDAYVETVGQDFLKNNVPRIIQVIGSPAYNSEGTIVLGTAEGGLKVTLYMANELTDDLLHDYATLNDYYFHTLHHEFTHILNQKKAYDTSFDLITESGYISGDWYMISDTEANKRGFVTAYAMSQGLEDFAEMLSVYVTDSPEEWNSMIAGAGDGARYINAKLAIVRDYMQSSWNLDIDELRSAVQHRAKELSSLNLNELK